MASKNINQPVRHLQQQKLPVTESLRESFGLVAHLMSGQALTRAQPLELLAPEQAALESLEMQATL